MCGFITLANERDATLADWLAVYGYLIERDARWLVGLVANDLLKRSVRTASEKAG